MDSIGDYWIGSDDVAVEGDWVWVSDGRKISDQNYTNWKLGQPDNHATNEDCMQLLNTGAWNDAPCVYSTFFICEASFRFEVA